MTEESRDDQEESLWAFAFKIAFMVAYSVVFFATWFLQRDYWNGHQDLWGQIATFFMASVLMGLTIPAVHLLRAEGYGRLYVLIPEAVAFVAGFAVLMQLVVLLVSSVPLLWDKI